MSESGRHVTEWWAAPVHRAGARLGECPVWDAERGELLWLDIDAQRLHAFHPQSGPRRPTQLDERVTAVAPRAGGGLVCATTRGFGHIDASGRVGIVAAIESDRPDAMMNDGKCDPAGRFLAGTTTQAGVASASGLYRLELDSTVSRLVDGVIESNGLDWSPDGRRLYYVDTGTQRVDVFDYDARTGALSGRRVLARFPDAYGVPDGLTVDAEGCLWLAFWDGGAVRRLDPAGNEIGIVRVPASRPTSCAFGGPLLRDLFITSATWDLDVKAEPDAGSLFVAHPGVSGRLPTRSAV